MNLKLKFWDAVIARAKRIDRRWAGPLPPLPPPVPLMPGAVRSILVFKPDEIGDAVMALPALKRLRKHFPQAQITVLAQSGPAVIYARSGLVDKVITVKVRTWGYRFSNFDLPAALAAGAVAEYDLAIFLRAYPSYFRLFKKVPSKVKLHPRHRWMQSPSLYQVGLGGHEVSQRLKLDRLVESVAPGPADFSTSEFHWEESDRELPVRVDTDYLVIHPYNKYETKRYPYWKELIRFLQKEFSLPIYVIGGLEDASEVFPGTTPLAGKLTLGQTGYLLSSARAFLGNESGPGHWANALGIPAVSLMGGHSDRREWGLSGEALVFQDSVPCLNCHRRVCPGKGLICLRDLTVERIGSEISAYLQRVLSQPRT